MSKIKINLESLKTRREWKRHKVNQGHNLFRFLPPFGPTSEGYPYKRWVIAWMLDPETSRKRPYASSLLTEKRCPIIEYVNQLRARIKTLEAHFLSSGMSEENVKERLKDLNQVVRDLNPKSVYVYNAVNKAGEVGLLELKPTAHAEVTKVMSDYVTEYNQDPTSLNSDPDDSGIWMDIIRTGENRTTKYEVRKNQLKMKNENNQWVYIDDTTPLQPSIADNFDSLAYDLSNIYQKKTYDELKEVLDANLALIFEACPEADLSVELDVDAPLATPVEAKKTVKPTAAQPRVTTRFDQVESIPVQEEEDDVPVSFAPATPATVARTPVARAPAPTPTKTRMMAPVTAKPAVDDDFMQYAENILSGK